MVGLWERIKKTLDITITWIWGIVLVGGMIWGTLLALFGSEAQRPPPPDPVPASAGRIFFDALSDITDPLTALQIASFYLHEPLVCIAGRFGPESKSQIKIAEHLKENYAQACELTNLLHEQARSTLEGIVESGTLTENLFLLEVNGFGPQEDEWIQFGFYPELLCEQLLSQTLKAGFAVRKCEPYIRPDWAQ